MSAIFKIFFLQNTNIPAQNKTKSTRCLSGTGKRKYHEDKLELISKNTVVVQFFLANLLFTQSKFSLDLSVHHRREAYSCLSQVSKFYLEFAPP